MSLRLVLTPHVYYQDRSFRATRRPATVEREEMAIMALERQWAQSPCLAQILQAQAALELGRGLGLV